MIELLQDAWKIIKLKHRIWQVEREIDDIRKQQAEHIARVAWLRNNR